MTPNVRHKTTTVLLFSGILWVRNLDRAQLGWLIPIPLGLGPLLGKFQWLGAEIICCGIGTEWPKSWAQLGTACGSTYTWPHPVAPPSQLLVTGSPVGASEAWVYQETRVERAWSLLTWPQSHAVSTLPHSVDYKWVTKVSLILGERNLVGKWQGHIAKGHVGWEMLLPLFLKNTVCHSIKRCQFNTQVSEFGAWETDLVCTCNLQVII